MLPATEVLQDVSFVIEVESRRPNAVGLIAGQTQYTRDERKRGTMSERENNGNAVPELTEAHVFQSIADLETQADEEIREGITYCNFWLGEGFDGRKADYEPVIKRALGIRHFAVEDSPEDRAFAERHSTSWYYFIVRPTPDRFTIIKARSPSPCPSFVLQMAGITDAYYRAMDEVMDEEEIEDRQVFTLCGTEAEEGAEPQEGAAVARRAWHLALNQGGRCAMLSTKAAIDPDDETGEGAENDAREPWICMDEDDLDDVWRSFFPTARHLALMRKLRAAALIVAPLLGLYKAVLEKTYAPSGAGYKRARDDFEAHRQA